jgi:enediyne biosynthesis protein E4
MRHNDPPGGAGPIMGGNSIRLIAVLAAGLHFVRGPSVGAAGPPRPPFDDATHAAGLEFIYDNGMSGALLLPEIMGGGAALFDFDNDGDLDLYLVQGGSFGPGGEPQKGREHDRLWLNVGTGGGDPRFADVSVAAGLSPAGYGMGVAAGDYDNDGWTDLLVTGYGSLRLLRNRSGRRLEDVTARARVADAGWSVSASFADIDGDGWLDVFLPRYVEQAPVRCVLPSSRPDYCGPKSYWPQPHRVFRNRADGAFEEATSRWLGPHRPGPGLGVLAADLDGDGRTDVYVANDGADNHLWLNSAGGALREEGLLAGAALSGRGVAQAGMGVDAGDADGDLDLDLFVTNLTGEGGTLYVNQGVGLFEDGTAASGLLTPTLPLTGFGARFVDYDNDGWLDLVVVNGAVHLRDPAPGATDPYPLAQPRLVLRNVGAGRFEDVTHAAGEAFTRPEVGRGVAAGDVDNDGDVDLVVVNSRGPARLLLNRVGQDQPWVGLRLVTRDGRRDALGARVRLRRGQAADLLRHAHADGSYASASDPRVLFGLAGGADLTRIEVRWPDGADEEFGPPGLRRYTVVRQGTGRVVAAGRAR